MDPERDDVKKVAKYFDAHADNFISLNADSFKQAQVVAMDYGAFFSKKGQLSSGDYEIEHPGHIFLIDPLGNLRFTYSAQHKQAERMVSDLRYLQVQH
jgi:protein SCO1/2